MHPPGSWALRGRRRKGHGKSGEFNENRHNALGKRGKAVYTPESLALEFSCHSDLSEIRLLPLANRSLLLITGLWGCFNLSADIQIKNVLLPVGSVVTTWREGSK